MNFKFKYIIIGHSSPVPIIFGDLISHAAVANGRGCRSAGFCYLDQERGATCFDGSTTLDLKSMPEEDAKEINLHFKLGEYTNF